MSALANRAHENHAVENRDAPEGDKTNRSWHGQVFPGDKQAQNPANRSQGQHADDERRQPERAKQHEQEKINRRNSDRNDHGKMPERPLQILKLPAPFQGVARRQGDLCRDLGLKFVDEPAEITAVDVHADDDPATSQFARDLRRPLSNLNAGNAFEWDLRPPRRRQQQIANRLRVISEALGNPNRSRKSPLAFVDIRHPLTA